ncbi:hypothetical protein BDN70DRAFT_927496 [Pholiota conissans]|uniref:Uncharacterized protein n=1 Tax=Pholiota conissans TaxID=109636 RepID=A0A9P5ZDR1_9AGAR|nr:hypothetical protein BDN70DRAFT_927496 [Pholiota conissans]
MPNLPLDVIEAIIEVLYTNQSDLPTIKELSLVCHALLHWKKRSARSDTVPTAVAGTVRQLSRLLSTTPEIGVYIRRLHLDYIKPPNFRVFGPESFLSEREAFGKITNLYTLEIHHFS